jgi:hypothetical protein
MVGIKGHTPYPLMVTEAGATLQASSNERTNWLSRLRNFRVGMTRGAYPLIL